jgi:hypothetical protein
MSEVILIIISAWCCFLLSNFCNFKAQQQKRWRSFLQVTHACARAQTHTHTHSHAWIKMEVYTGLLLQGSTATVRLQSCVCKRRAVGEILVLRAKYQLHKELRRQCMQYESSAVLNSICTHIWTAMDPIRIRFINLPPQTEHTICTHPMPKDVREDKLPLRIEAQRLWQGCRL